MAVLVVEAATGRRVGRLELAEMPLPGDGRRVARLAERIRQRAFLERQPEFRSRIDDRIHPGAGWVAPGQQRRPRGRTHRLHVKIIQDGPLRRERVDIRRVKILAAIEPGVGETHVINQEIDNVWLRQFGGLGGAVHKTNQATDD